MSVRLYLRDQTLRHHMDAERVHQGVVDARNLRQYLDYLGTMQRAHARLGLPAAMARGDDPETRHHARAIEAIAEDLASDGGPPDTGPGVIVSPAYGWGVSYALIGSALGAYKILRALDRQTEWPRRYLRLSADFVREGGVQRFFRALDAAAPSGADAKAGAADVFALVADRGHAGKRPVTAAPTQLETR